MKTTTTKICNILLESTFIAYHVIHSFPLHQRITLCFILTAFCDRGYFYNTSDNECRPCPEGQYKSKRGIDTCWSVDRAITHFSHVGQLTGPSHTILKVDTLIKNESVQLKFKMVPWFQRKYQKY
jgi:hypothetical protein